MQEAFLGRGGKPDFMVSHQGTVASFVWLLGPLANVPNEDAHCASLCRTEQSQDKAHHEIKSILASSVLNVFAKTSLNYRVGAGRMTLSQK